MHDCIVRSSAYVGGEKSLARERHDQMQKRSPNRNDNYAAA